MTDEVNLENIDDLPINLDAVSADDDTADAQEVQIDQAEAASVSEDIAEGMAYDAVNAGDDAEPSDKAAAQKDSLTDSVDDSAAVDSAAHSEGTADESTQHAEAEEASADEALETAAEAEEEAEEDAGAKAVKEFSKSLRTLEGKWYVLHTYSGYEKRVKSNIESRVQSFGLEDTILGRGAHGGSGEAHREGQEGRHPRARARLRAHSHVPR